jgi:preprotein translocase subunit SecD
MTDNTTNQTQSGGTGSDDGNTPIHPRAAEFDIPKFVQKKHSDLINLVFETKSMDDKERQYWFHILPIMSEKQVEKLRNILNKEKSKLSTIDNQYKKKITDMQKEKANKWEQQNIKKKFEAIHKKEASHEELEQAAEAQLLKQLENM